MSTQKTSADPHFIKKRSSAKDTPCFILASNSPRRLDLLAQIAITPDQIIPANIDETPRNNEVPKAYAERMACEKAAAISAKNPNAWILAADTVVAAGRRIIPKAETEDQAKRALHLLSGRRHRVITGIALVKPDGSMLHKTVCSVVRFKVLAKTEIDHYIQSGEWRGKAGGYAIQGLAATFVQSLSGSYSNIVGLPLFEVAGWLASVGYVNNKASCS